MTKQDAEKQIAPKWYDYILLSPFILFVLIVIPFSDWRELFAELFNFKKEK